MNNHYDQLHETKHTEKMKHTQEDHEYYGNWLIVFSEDDEEQCGKGWYGQDTSKKGWPTTDLYESKRELIQAIKKAKS